MKCPECGNENPDRANFCSSCGADFRRIYAEPNLRDDPEAFGFAPEETESKEPAGLTQHTGTSGSYPSYAQPPKPQKKHSLLKWVIVFVLLYSCVHKSENSSSSASEASSSAKTVVTASPVPAETQASETETVNFKGFYLEIPQEYTFSDKSEDGTTIAYKQGEGTEKASNLILWNTGDAAMDDLITDGSGAEEEMQQLFEAVINLIFSDTYTFTETAAEIRTDTAGIYAYAGQADLTGDYDDVNYLRYVMLLDINTDQFLFIFESAKEDPGVHVPDQIARTAAREIPSSLSAVYNGSAAKGTEPVKSDFTVTASYADGGERKVLQGFEVSSAVLEAGRTSSVQVSYLGVKTSVDITCSDAAPTPEPTPVPTPEATTGERNALSSAKTYLSFMPFSYSGLMEQLEYEGYSESEAAYAADNCGADWNEQAAKSAANYLSFMSFSRSGLIEQLEYEGFTEEQAEYGVQANGY